MRPERQVVTIVGYKTLRTAERGRPVLLAEIARIIAVRYVVVFHRHISAKRVCPLEEEPVGELLPDGYLQAVVIGIRVKSGSAHAYRLVAEIRYAVKNVQRSVRRDPVDRVRRTGQL